MQYDDLPESSNIEDRRGEGPTGGGGFGGIPGGAGGLSIGTVVVLGLIGWALGIDPRFLIGGAEILTQEQPRTSAPSQTRPTGSPTDDTGRFVSRVLGSTEAVWKEEFAKKGSTYVAPRLVLFNKQTDAACGGRAESAMGPFYCPSDKKVYLDTSFFQDIETRFRGCEGKACQFSQAYVIAHEVGHHVQNLLGVMDRMTRARQRASAAERNALSVRLELQADCFAGVWAHSTKERGLLEEGDLAEGLAAAQAVGDDRLGANSPEQWTHGSSALRVEWFRRGFDSGDPDDCDTGSVEI